MDKCPVRDMPMSGASCYGVLKQYVDIPEGATGFRIDVEAYRPSTLMFLKEDWKTQTIHKYKGIVMDEFSSEIAGKLLVALGVTDLGEVSSVVVEVNSINDIVTTTIKQATTHGQLEDCLKLLKGESNVIPVNS